MEGRRIVLIALVCIAALAQDPPKEITAAKVISNMLARYYSAATLVGTIKTETKDDAGSILFTTEVAYERPSKIYVAQDRKGRNGLNHLLVSDGVDFAYDPPRSTPVKPKPLERLFEPVTIKNFAETWSHKIGDIYAVGHSSLEFCVSLDVVIAHETHLLELKTQMATYELKGVEDYKGRKAYRITGTWRQSLNAIPTGNFTMLIGAEFDLLSFTLKEKYEVGTKKDVSFTQTEICDVRVGGTVSADLFKVR